jgi:hypothetical protein
LPLFENKPTGRIFESDIKIIETGENYTLRNFIIYTIHQILLGWKISEDELARSYNMHRGDGKFMCIYIYRNSWTVPLICRKISTNEFIS